VLELGELFQVCFETSLKLTWLNPLRCASETIVHRCRCPFATRQATLPHVKITGNAAWSLGRISEHLSAAEHLPACIGAVCSGIANSSLRGHFQAILQLVDNKQHCLQQQSLPNAWRRRTTAPDGSSRLPMAGTTDGDEGEGGSLADPVPVLDLEPFLRAGADATAPTLAALCASVAACLHRTGCLVVRRG
jgi:hypothetical protein